MTSTVWLRGFLVASVAIAALSAQSGGLDPSALLEPLSGQWSSYSGDYTGRRYSALTQIDQTTVKNLGLAWTARLAGGAPAGGLPASGANSVVVGGEGSGDVVVG